MAGLYIHIPFCKSRCIYCAFYSTTDSALRQRYVEAVIKEMATHPCPSLKGWEMIYLIYIIEELLQLRDGELRRRPSSQIDGFDTGQGGGLHLLDDRIHVPLAQCAVGGGVERAVDAATLTKGNMYV